MSSELQRALAAVKEVAERDGSGVIYLHASPTSPSFGVLLMKQTPEGLDSDALTIALNALERAGWNVYDHSHLDGDD